MAKTQSARFEIEKFNGKNNFEIRKVKMYDLLVQQGVAKALMRKSKQPYNITNDEWTEMDERALSAIRLCLAGNVLFNIVSEKTNVGLWTKLEKLYMTKTLTNRILLKRQLYSLRMKEGTLITDHMNTFNTLLVQLESIEVKFESEDKAITLLCSLPESWDHIVTSKSLSSSETLEFEDVVAYLLSEETRRRSNLETSTSEAMMVRGRSKERRFNRHNDSRSKSKGKKSKVKCWFYGKSGHLKKDCWKRQRNSKEDSSIEKKRSKHDRYRFGIWFRTDNGGEFTSKEFDNYCKDAGIERHKTTVYTPQQNGVAERMNKTLLERARSMLSNANLQKELWIEAVATTCYVINRSPSTAIGCKIPQELDVDNKLKQDNVSDFQHIQFETTSDDSQNEHSSDASHEQVSDTDHEQGSDVDHEHVSDADHEEVSTNGNQPIVEAPETSLRRSTRMKRPPKRYDDYVTSVAFTANDDEPLCYEEAVEGSESEKWKAAMKDEMMALGKNGTCDLVELPKDRKTVGCKWVFKLKRGVDDTEDRYKARLVAKGFS
eukprot:PITA_28237